jgi:hypothetical protein
MWGVRERHIGPDGLNGDQVGVGRPGMSRYATGRHDRLTLFASAIGTGGQSLEVFLDEVGAAAALPLEPPRNVIAGSWNEK